MCLLLPSVGDASVRPALPAFKARPSERAYVHASVMIVPLNLHSQKDLHSIKIRCWILAIIQILTRI
jgi:hypothetical protein